MVLHVSPVLAYVVALAVVVMIGVQVVPLGERSILKPNSTLLVSVQDRLICVLEAGLAVRVGTPQVCRSAVMIVPLLLMFTTPRQVSREVEPYHELLSGLVVMFQVRFVVEPGKGSPVLPWLVLSSS